MLVFEANRFTYRLESFGSESYPRVTSAQVFVKSMKRSHKDFQIRLIRACAYDHVDFDFKLSFWTVSLTSVLRLSTVFPMSFLSTTFTG